MLTTFFAAVVTVRFPSNAGIEGSFSVGFFNTSEIEIECLVKTAISNNCAQLAHSDVGVFSASCQKYDKPGRGEEGTSSVSLAHSAMLTLFSNFAKRSVMATESELTVSQLVVLLTRLSFSHVPALAGTSVNIAK